VEQSTTLTDRKVSKNEKAYPSFELRMTVCMKKFAFLRCETL